jgi:hypothetical protein
MKAAALIILMSLAALTGVRAETNVSGFQPRFGTVPNPAYADEPNYRPPSRPPHTYDFSVGVDVGRRTWGPRDYTTHRGRHRISPWWLYK